MPSSLISEKVLTVSPTLAATIGLDEALMLQLLHDLSVTQSPKDGWHTVGTQTLLQLLPFWQLQDCERICSRLRDLGVIYLNSAPLDQAADLRFRFDEATKSTGSSASATYPTAATGGKSKIAPRWQPDPELFRQLALHGIPREFCDQQLAEFIMYWADRGEPAYSWNSKFRSQVIRRWREREVTRTDQPNGPEPMRAGWFPSEDALEILQRSGVNAEFIEDSIAEFVLYWNEQGEVARTWNSRFVSHIRRQWARFTATMDIDSEPRLLPPQWQPSADVWDILKLANIDPGFAKGLLPEFQIYWRDAGEAHSSWNSKFLQHVKYHWARSHRQNAGTGQQHGIRQTTSGAGSTRSRSLSEDLSDRSWAG